MKIEIDDENLIEIAAHVTMSKFLMRFFENQGYTIETNSGIEMSVCLTAIIAIANKNAVIKDKNGEIVN